MPQHFLRKNWKNTATTKLIESGSRIGGGVLAAFANKKVMEGGKSSNTSETLKNVFNPGLLIASTLGVLTLENNYLSTMCEGVQVISFVNTIKRMAPEVATATGLMGIEDDAALMGTVAAVEPPAEQKALPEDFDGVTPQTDGNDWNAVAEQIDNEKSIESDGAYQEVNGIAAVEDAALF